MLHFHHARVNTNPSMVLRKAVSVVFLQSLVIWSSDSAEPWWLAILTRDKPHTPSRKQFGSGKEMVKEIVYINQQILITAYQKKKKIPFLQQNPFLNSFWRVQHSCWFAVLFISREFHGTGYFLIYSTISWQCFGWSISLARTRAEFEFQILVSTQLRLPFQEVL